jgi:epoxyqueuosine reductase
MLSSEIIKKTALSLGVDIVGICKAESVGDKNKFIEIMNNGHFGEMEYLKRNQSERFDPRVLLKDACSIISVGINNRPSDTDIEKSIPVYKVARYAWADDYHIVLRNILNKLRDILKESHENLNGRICVDTAPFMDKYWGEMAGLGWRGKHTVLVNKRLGCFLNLGALVLDVKVDKYDQALRDHCGRCNECVEACPTGALISPYRLDASKCISYWTIESSADEIPLEIKRKLNGWVYGCDICINACPYNKFNTKSNRLMSRRDEIELVESGQAASLLPKEFESRFRGTPFIRPGLKELRRNFIAAR